MTRPNVQLEREEARVAALSPLQRQKERRAVWAVSVLLLGLAVYLTVLVWPERRAEMPTTTGPAALSTLSPYTALVACQDAARGQLAAPTSAVFQDGALPTFTGGMWVYAGTVDSQNALGVMLRSGYACSVTGAYASGYTASVAFR